MPEKLDTIFGTHFGDYECTKDNAYENSFGSNHLHSVAPDYDEIPEYVAVRTDGVLKVDLETLEVEKIAIEGDWEIYGIISADDEQIVFRGDHQRSKLENQTSPGTKRVIYTLKDQSYTIMTEN